jgi:hypothetical protein
MTTRSIAQSTRHHLATFSAVGSLLLSSAVLVACGGGGGVAGGGTGATVTGLSVGTVSGKGSTIVNGVRFDDSGAEVRGEDESLTDDKGGSLNGESVKVGMEVEVEHGVVTCSADPSSTVAVPLPDICTGVATKISFGNNSLVAPITDFVPGDAAATPATFATFKLLGQSVSMSASTVVNLESFGVPLGDGVVVEVHGSFDPITKVTTATRVEVKAATAGAFTGALRLRGVLDLSVTPATIGGTKVTLSDTQKVGLVAGQVVRAKLSGTAEPYTVVSIKSTQRKLDDHKGGEAELEGVVTGLDKTTSGVVKFTINGAPVSIATTVTGSATLADGQRVEVEGKVDSSGTLVARKVTAHNESSSSSDPAAAPEEFHGRIVKPDGAGGFVNSYVSATRTFGVYASTLVSGVLVTTLRETIQIDDNTKFVGNKSKDFSEDALSKLGSDGLVVIYGRRSADGTFIIATKIKKDTSTE